MPASGLLKSIVTLTVLLSSLLQGITVYPLARLYGGSAWRLRRPRRRGAPAPYPSFRWVSVTPRARWRNELRTRLDGRLQRPLRAEIYAAVERSARSSATRVDNPDGRNHRERHHEPPVSPHRAGGNPLRQDQVGGHVRSQDGRRGQDSRGGEAWRQKQQEQSHRAKRVKQNHQQPVPDVSTVRECADQGRESREESRESRPGPAPES